jgi:hypothetical protein
VVLGELLVQSFLATILFDSGASHSFISSYFVETHDISTVTLKKPLLTKSPGGHIPCHLGVSNIPIILSEVAFPTNLVILNSHGIDVILGMDWLLVNQASRKHRLSGKNRHYHQPPRRDGHLPHPTKSTRLHHSQSQSRKPRTNPRDKRIPRHIPRRAA